ncbi:MAG: DUF438 domain-containing protein [Thermoproteota archaeon]
MANKEELKAILKRLRIEEDLAKVEGRLRLLLQDVDPETLSLAEQELIEEGFKPEEIRRLCDIHLKAITLKREGHTLEESHPISILKVEHEIILNNLKMLEKAVNRIKPDMNLDKLNEELKKIEPIAELLLETESHHQREERALFPRLEERGITGPPNVMRVEHEDLRARKKALKKLLEERDKLDPSYIVKRVREIGSYIVSVLGDHIYKENNILYPLALRVVPENEWSKIREEFDGIGYCCFTPKATTQSEHRHL